MHPFRIALAPLLLIMLLAAGCATLSTTTPKTPDDFVKEAEETLRRGLYEEATNQWKKIREANYSPAITTQAELRLADTHFEAENFIEAAAAYEEFRKNHPSHEKVPYTLYRQGLSQFKQVLGFDTDQTGTRNARALFDQLVKLYPQSEYAADAKAKSEEARTTLYRHEIYVGAFYLRTGKVQSAIKRLDEALRTFPPLAGTDELLFNLGKAYIASGNRDKGRDILLRLASDYASSPFSKEAASLAKTN
jgi:outer membrane protein assembly factor BamD